MTMIDSTAPSPLKIVVDQPTSSLGLGYNKYVDALASVVTGGEPARFTVGIYGAWGVGKSSVLKALDAKVSSNEIPVVTFDAWRYARHANVIVPLLHEVEAVLSARGGKLWMSIGRALRAIISEVSFSVAGLTLSGKAVNSAMDAVAAPAGQARADIPHFRLKEIGDELTDEGERIVVMIDDLDRCPPNAIVQVLEAVHVLTDVQGFVFVLALDYEALVRAVESEYAAVVGALFIEKIILIPFWIPEVDRSGPVIADVVPEWKDLLGLDAAAAVTLEKVVHMALRTNPRQVKRLVNSMLIARRILGVESVASVDSSLLLAVIGLQLRWPHQFKTIHLALAGDPDNRTLGDVLSAVKSFEDDELSAYLKAVLPDKLVAVDVLDAMRYSQTTASAVAQPHVTVEPDGEAGSLVEEIMAGPRSEEFDRVRTALEQAGASLLARQQYISVRKGTRAFLRLDAGPLTGVRVFFPDSMNVDADDEECFKRASGARAVNFERYMVVDPASYDVFRKYLARVMSTF
jgi:hypothetical protein